MSENLQGEVEQKRSPYESVRDSQELGEDRNGEPNIGTLWRSADRWRAHLREEAAKIQSDPDLSDEGKQSRIDALHSRISGRITKDSTKAREIAQAKAAEARERSIPGARSARVQDPQVHTNVLLESNELLDRARRLRESTPKGMQPGARISEMLRREYRDATEAGGIAGATSCQAVLRAAKSLGVDPEDIYADLRDENHNAALDEAYRFQQAADLIPTDVPKLSRGVSYGNHWKSGATPRMAIPKGGPLGGGARRKRPAWK